jgi:RNA polymerase sigma factor (TIGR02999 family)
MYVCLQQHSGGLGLTARPAAIKVPARTGPGGWKVCTSDDKSQMIQELLADWHGGDVQAVQAILPLVYDELRRVAHRHLQRERREHTLQSTALVHEVYLRLEKQGSAKIENRAHLLAICAQLMRQILVDYARARKATKREGGERVTLDGLPLKGRAVDLLALDDALRELAKLDPQQSQIVQLKFFGGLSIEEICELLSLSPMTVKRRWASAKLWLQQQLSKAES